MNTVVNSTHSVILPTVFVCCLATLGDSPWGAVSLTRGGTFYFLNSRRNYMALVAAKCTQCGAKIEVDNSVEAGICSHCGTSFITEKVITNYVTSYNAINYDNRTIIKHIHGKELPEVAEYIRNADAFIKMEDYAQAEEQLNLAAKADPSDWRVWFGMIRLVTQNFNDISSTPQRSSP